ncbi:bifunctional 2',3'-cyclic-nucleotide 2'-phosphodiesterase/3'-nucleotidase [Tahibacter amnicola]|uniref:Bifunctional 2',3'-cyclic-nucleotide 2'-phosphodiesterase/3'-nucleotidase n=1 Tax=Tahibacter amnicola TaxID=2976241 RepID=A0ABY6BDQ9_9GAMM|nr:bifunctional 2',3'-cyclic-nucleotide 2'-phosphodiesterase/3'-nucleotidase [Tahibacter amnicola]UXI68163.1 bifunctional 2',3'-cyclic-nucleotide 2'-phosphodiesterase/3'-nucleotidase [Tahibacter amnicola]
MMRRLPLPILTSLLLSACTTGPAGRHDDGPKPPADGARADVALLETTDLHSNVLSYDYFKGAADPTLGFERVATLVHAARKDFPNNFLFDDGDTIQGTALADHQALASPLACDQKLAMYKAMDALGYDGGTIGNHEFNYGLDFLAHATGTPLNVEGTDGARCTGPDFPLVLSNVYSSRDGKPLYAPYRVLTKSITAWTADGSAVQVPLRVGILGFTPQPILKWDKRNLEGKVTVTGIVEAAQRWVPELRSQDVDIVVAISHGGLNPDAYHETMENANWHLAGVPGIDALLMGHSHDVFPNASNPKSRFNTMAEVDNERGYVRGVPAVMAGYWGKGLGVIKLALVRQGGRWVVDKQKTYSEVRPICTAAKECVAADPAIARVIDAEHRAANAWVSTPIGRTAVRLNTYFSDLGEVSALGVINAAQRDYVARRIKTERPDLAAVPVLSGAAAFKAGFAGSEDYTDVAPGEVTIKSAADLYLYPNTIAAVHIDGKTLKGWLEKAAERFNQLDPAATTPQPLVNVRVPTYNFDVIQGGLRYTFDLSRPTGERVVALTYKDKPVAPDAAFIVATNNYRASGGIPGVDGSRIVLAEETTNRDIVIEWLKAHPTLSAKDIEPSPVSFARLGLKAPATFRSRTGKAAIAVAAGFTSVRETAGNGDGTSTYAVEF